MTRLLITGLSGTGKSTVIAELSRRGHQAVDFDGPQYSCWVPVDRLPEVPGTPVRPDQDWAWNTEAVARRLGSTTGVLFCSGCAANMRDFLRHFDVVVLLTAPDEVRIRRLCARTSGYGSTDADRSREMELRQTVEPALRRIATSEVDTSQPLDQTVTALLRLAGIGHHP